jgi:hypothetical protein
MRWILALGLTAVVAVGAGSSAFGRPATTRPGVIYVVNVPVDDAGVHIPKDRFTRNGVTRYPRGAEIRYEFTNHGSKPYAVFMWGADTVVMKPHGGHTSMFLNWQYRGSYIYCREYHGHRIRPFGSVVIF